jgi:hypothetical protein
MNCLSLATSALSLAASPSLDRSSKTMNPFRRKGRSLGGESKCLFSRCYGNALIGNCDSCPDPEGEEGCRLLAITGEIVASRTLAIFFFGSSKLLNLIVSALSA